MAEKLQVSLPESGKTVEYHCSPDVPVKFAFFVSEVVFSCDGNDLVLTGENGGAVVIKDYQTMANAGTLPDFELHGGETVPGDIYLFAFSGAHMDIETAAGTEAEMAGQGVDASRSGEDMETPDIPEMGGGDDHSSLAAPVFGEILAFGELLPTDADADVALPGVSACRCESPSLAGSLFDVHDPFADAVRHIIDSPEYG